jgi:hypothetical protein
MSSITKSSYLQILSSVIYISISYGFTEQPWEEHRILLFIMICVTATLTAQACGFLIGVVTPFKVCSSSSNSSSSELLSVHDTSGSRAFPVYVLLLAAGCLRTGILSISHIYINQIYKSSNC